MLNALLREFPHLDEAMATTLIHAYEKGTLESYDWDAVDNTLSTKNEQPMVLPNITIGDVTTIKQE